MPNYSKDQLWELYQGLPDGLKRAMFSEEIGENIRKACVGNGVVSEKTISDLAENVGYVFLGLLAPKELESVMKNDLKIEEGKAKIINEEISRLVFSSLKKSLDALYGADTISITIPKNSPVEKKPAAEAQPKRNLKQKDAYREPLE